MNKEAKIREIQKNQKEKAEIEELKADTIKMIEKKGKEAYQRDLGLNPSTESEMIQELSTWQEVTSKEGEVYYWHERSNKTQWEKPPGWEKYRKAREKYLQDQRKAKLAKINVHTAASRENAMLMARRGAASVGVGGHIATESGKVTSQRNFSAATSHIDRSDGPSRLDVKNQRNAYGASGQELFENPPDAVPNTRPVDYKYTENNPEMKKFHPMTAVPAHDLDHHKAKDDEDQVVDPTAVIPVSSKASRRPMFDGTDGDLDLGLPSDKDQVRASEKNYRNKLYSDAWTGEDNKLYNRIGKGVTERSLKSGAVAGGVKMSGLKRKVEKKEVDGSKTRTKIVFHKKVKK